MVGDVIVKLALFTENGIHRHWKKWRELSCLFPLVTLNCPLTDRLWSWCTISKLPYTMLWSTFLLQLVVFRVSKSYSKVSPKLSLKVEFVTLVKLLE